MSERRERRVFFVIGGKLHHLMVETGYLRASKMAQGLYSYTERAAWAKARKSALADMRKARGRAVAARLAATLAGEAMSLASSRRQETLAGWQEWKAQQAATRPGGES